MKAVVSVNKSSPLLNLFLFQNLKMLLIIRMGAYKGLMSVLRFLLQIWRYAAVCLVWIKFVMRFCEKLTGLRPIIVYL